ncbi:MAG: SDR family NAD(P)-dependent oxidoreductase, partial [Steroidobacteraceae bacterium]
MAGKVAVVTGAGSGIGKGVAIALAVAGYRVVLAGRRAEPLTQTASDAKGDVIVVPTDVCDPASVAKLFEAAVAQFG